MLDDSFIKLELAATFGLVILFWRTRQKVGRLPRHIKAVHWIFITIFSLIGANGLRFLALLLIRPERLELVFFQSSHFNIPLYVMQLGVIVFGIASILLYFVTMHLGTLVRGPRARKLFPYLAPFCGFFYPLIWFAALGLDQSSTSLMIGIALLVLGIAASVFYSRDLVNANLETPSTQEL